MDALYCNKNVKVGVRSWIIVHGYDLYEIKNIKMFETLL